VTVKLQNLGIGVRKKPDLGIGERKKPEIPYFDIVTEF
jgi:hypothetical protein